MAHMWMPHVTQVNDSCETCGWVMSRVSKTALKVASVGHARTSNVTRMNQSFYTKLEVSHQWWRCEYEFLNRSSHTWNPSSHNSNRQACAVEVLTTCLCFLHPAQSAPTCRSRVICKVCCSVLQRVNECYALHCNTLCITLCNGRSRPLHCIERLDLCNKPYRIGRMRQKLYWRKFIVAGW